MKNDTRLRAMKTAKLIVTVARDKSSKARDIAVRSILDNRTGEYWTGEEIAEHGLFNGIVASDELDRWGRKIGEGLDELKEVLNDVLDGDDSKYKFEWTETTKTWSMGSAFIFD